MFIYKFDIYYIYYVKNKMNTLEILKLYETSAKGFIEPHAKFLEIIVSSINLANEYHALQDWQLQMLDDIVNLACFNQSMCVYINTSLIKPVVNNGYTYNILMLESHKVYLINLDTKKCREIKYSFKHK